MEIVYPMIQISVKLKWADKDTKAKEILITPSPLTLEQVLQPSRIDWTVRHMLEQLDADFKAYLSKENPPYLVIKPAHPSIQRDALEKYVKDFINGVGKATGVRVEQHEEDGKKEVKSITFYLRNADTL